MGRGTLPGGKGFPPELEERGFQKVEGSGGWSETGVRTRNGS